MISITKITTKTLLVSLAFLAFSCSKDEDTTPTSTGGTTSTMSSATYDYEFNNGQVVSSAAYSGSHKDNLSASIKVDETGDNTAKITVTLTNTVDGEMYHIHAHDAADPATTPNGTPYNESPNSDVFTQHVMGNGGSVEVEQNISFSYSYVTSTYDGFFVVHDPLQSISTTDISTYLVVGTFAREQGSTGYSSSTFTYDFNTGQISEAYAYNGSHSDNLSGDLTIQELADGTSRVSITLHNSMNGEMYHTHAHDAADPATTPNGTPYDESPNTDLLTFMINGNGGMVTKSQMTSMSHSEITSNYTGFFVVHDPLQALSTTDPTTYVLLGSFAR